MVRTSSSVAAFATTFKQWEGVSFHPSDKFVLRMKFLRNDQFLGKPVSDYYVTITRSGRNDAEGCVSGDVNKTIYVNPNGGPATQSSPPADCELGQCQRHRPLLRAEAWLKM